MLSSAGSNLNSSQSHVIHLPRRLPRRSTFAHRQQLAIKINSIKFYNWEENRR